jgi:DNA helicase HerA-like ATPase
VSDFAQAIAAAYAVDGPAVDLGRGVHKRTLHPDARVQVALRMLTRHGLIAGATGTGKTKTLQVIAEQLSAQGVPVFVADVKGDVSGIADPGDPVGPGAKRAADLGMAYEPSGFPTEFLSIGGIGPGVPIRATVSDFGPQLMAKVLDANETQESSLALVFHLADERGLPLLDLTDLRALLTYLSSPEGKAELEGIGGVSKATIGVLLRRLVAIETGGGAEFFGEPQLDVSDLMRTAPDGRGIVSCLELPAVQDKPLLWSTVLMWLVAELFETLPEVGDVDRPKLVFFLDEAHLLFTGASKEFVASVVQTVRLIRSKGVGIFFITQSPKDIPGDVLAQLGSRVQHALRAFTPEDQEALQAAVKTYPTSELYDVEELLTSTGIGEAAITLLDERGVPTPVVHARLPGPRSRMSPTDDVAGAAAASPLMATYGTRVDAESAREILGRRVEEAAAHAERVPAPSPSRPRRRRAPAPAPAPDGGIGDFLTSSAGRQLQRELIRGVFGLLKRRR